MGDPMELPDMRVARYRFALEPLETIHLPPYKGSALRGGFGHALKRLVCYHSHGVCRDCGLGNDCVYGYLFETAPPDDTEVLSTHEAVPRPFVIQPPRDRRGRYEPGQELAFHLVLIGHGVAYLPYFVLGFQELGKAGLGERVDTPEGRRRGTYGLREVQALHPLDGRSEPIYDGDTLVDTELDVGAAQIAAWAGALPPDRLTVDFVTPARLKHAGKYARDTVDFHVLVRALLRRLSSLAYFHCGAQWDTDYRGWVERAQRVRVAESHLSWMDWGRRSGRQKRRIDMGGVVGSVTYEGDLADFRPLLALGALVHVGKGAVFGNGQYRVNHR